MKKATAFTPVAFRKTAPQKKNKPLFQYSTQYVGKLRIFDPLKSANMGFSESPVQPANSSLKNSDEIYLNGSPAAIMNV